MFKLKCTEISCQYFYLRAQYIVISNHRTGLENKRRRNVKIKQDNDAREEKNQDTISISSGHQREGDSKVMNIK